MKLSNDQVNPGRGGDTAGSVRGTTPIDPHGFVVNPDAVYAQGIATPKTIDKFVGPGAMPGNGGLPKP